MIFEGASADQRRGHHVDGWRATLQWRNLRSRSPRFTRVVGTSSELTVGERRRAAATAAASTHTTTTALAQIDCPPLPHRVCVTPLPQDLAVLPALQQRAPWRSEPCLRSGGPQLPSAPQIAILPYISHILSGLLKQGLSGNADCVRHVVHRDRDLASDARLNRGSVWSSTISSVKLRLIGQPPEKSRLAIAADVLDMARELPVRN